MSEPINMKVEKASVVVVGDTTNAVLYVKQTLTDEQKAQARENIGVGAESISNAVNEYLKDNPVHAGATAEEAAQIAQNKQDIENLSDEKLDASKLPEAVNEALAQAKASGEFDGKDGKDGTDGQDGYTPVKGVDYFDGADGKDGQNGTDYVLTEADKQEIAERAAELVEVPEGGTVTDEQIASAVEDYMAEHPINAKFPNTYKSKDYGATGDGVTDDSPALNELVALVNANGGGTIYLEKGTYMLDSPILWKSNVNLIGDGVGLSILKTRQAAGVGTGFAAIRGLTFTGSNPCVNCTFTQFTIDGSEMNITSYSSWPKGINIHFMKDCVFRDIVIQNTCATGLGIDFLENVTMDNILCYNCGRSFSTGGAEANVGGAGIGIGTKKMDKESFIIRNCVADGCGNYGIFLEDQGGGTNTDFANFVIANNIVKNGRNHGIVIKGGDRVIVSNNVVYNNAKYGLAVLENNGFLSDVIKITGNLSYENGTGFAIDCNGVTKDIFFSDNVVSDCDYGISILSGVTDLEIMRNTIKKCTIPVTLSAVTLVNFVYQHNILLNNTNAVNNAAIFTGDTSYNDMIELVEPTAISFAESETTLKEGNTITLSVSFTPSNSNGIVTYTSNMPDIASVSGNKLTAVSIGAAVITATCGELIATMTVYVEERQESDTDNLLDGSVNWIDGQYIDNAGNIVVTSGQMTYDGFVDVSECATLYFSIPSVQVAKNTTWRLIEYDENMIFIKRTIGLPLDTGVNISETTAYVKVGISGANGNNDVSNEMMTKIQKHAILSSTMLEEKDFEMSDYEYEKFIYNDAGEKVPNNNSATTVDFFEVPDGATAYYLDMSTYDSSVAYVACFDNNKNFLGRWGELAVKNVWREFELSDGTKYVKFRFGASGGATAFNETTMWNNIRVLIV